MSIQIVTFMGKVPAPHETYYRPEKMFASVRKYGYEPVVLGVNEWGGLGSKVKLLKKAIDSGVLHADHLILTDSFDVVFADSPDRIVDRFLGMQFESPARPSIIWNSERSCFSDASLAPKHPYCRSSFKYLNSGFGVGEIQGFRKVFEELDPELIQDDHTEPDGTRHEENDQDWWMRRFLFGSLSISLDTDTHICAALHSVEEHELDFAGEKIRVIENDTYPLVWHFNGDAKNRSYRDTIESRLVP
jgi:hypothetical protein